MEHVIKGRVWKLGDDIDTDLIYPGKYLPILDPSEMASHALEGYDKEFPMKLQAGDVIIAGSNFGCGSSREQAAVCLKTKGVSAVIAKSFARIFLRNAINQGLMLIQADLNNEVADGDVVLIDLDKNSINVNFKHVEFPALDPSVQAILDAGGLIPFVKRKIGVS